jgi:hypothetical protein
LALALLLPTSVAFAAGPPLVSGTAISAVGESSVILEAMVNPNGRPTKYHFEYIADSAYRANPEGERFLGATSIPVPDVSLPTSGTSDLPVSEPVSGLAPGTTYHYRLVASNVFSPKPDGTPGPVRIFATYAALQKFASCPNNDLRSEASATLSDCRAFEQVSPLDKNGVDANGDIFRIQAAVSGDAVTFVSNSGIPGGVGGQEFPTYLSHRGEDDWTTRGLLPPPSFGPRASILGWTPDLAYSFGIASVASAFEPSLLSRASNDDTIQAIVPGTPNAIFAFPGSSADDSKIFIEAVGARLTPDAVSSKDNLYLFNRDTGTLSLVGILPDSACLASPCVPPGGSFAGPYDWWGGATSRGGAVGDPSVAGAPGFFTQQERAVSASGDRVYFTAGQSAKEGGRIYLREGLDGASPQTAWVSASEKTNGEGPGGTDAAGTQPAAFQIASLDGSSAFFTSSEKLTNDANTGPDFPPPPPPSIGRSNLEGGEVQQGLIPAARGTGIAVDGSHVYWSDPEAGAILRANLDGTGVDEEFITGINPVAVTVDGSHVYWPDPKGTIGRAKIDGGEVKSNFITGASDPRGVAVDASHVYWTNAGTHSIGRAKIDGGEVMPSFKEECTCATPQAIAVDGTHIYYSDEESGQWYIESDTLDLSVHKFFSLGSGNESNGVALDGSHIYWTNSNSIGRAALNFSSPQESFISDLLSPRGIAVDGSHLYWSSVPFNPINPGNDLYRYDVAAEAGHHLTDLTVDLAKNGAEVQGVVGASEDGSYLYFVANGDLDGTGPATAGTCSRSGAGRFDYSGECSLYVNHGGQSTFIARLDSAGDGNVSDAADWQPNPAWGQGFSQVSTARVSPDGQTLLFRSRRQVGSYENVDTPEFYRYRVGDGGPICISCNPTGGAPFGRPALQSIALPTASGQAGVVPPSILTRNLSADGERVFFDSPDKLVGADINGLRDVYEWEAPESGSCTEASSAFSSDDGGCLYLLSGGRGAYPSFLADASTSGEDVFIFTRDPLVAQDTDRIQDLYDVRVLGGLASQNQVPPPNCESAEACHGQASPPPVSSSPGSASFAGPANPKPIRKKGHRHKKRHRKQHHRNAKTTRRTGR